MLDTLSRNLRHQDRDVAIFEIGRVYLPQGDELPDERRVLTLGSGQYRSAASWGQRQDVDFFDMKGAAEAVLERMGLQSPTFRVSFVAARHPSFHTGRTALISLERSAGRKGKNTIYEAAITVGLLGEVHPNVCANYDIQERAYILAFDLSQLIELAGRPGASTGAFRPIPRFPAVMQDISFTIPENSTAAQVEEVMRRAGGGLVTGVRLFDLYQGERVPAGMKSLAYSITYQAPDRTLKSDEVADSHARIEKRLEQELGAVVRK
jgi:phenylalanyl-tRNA synthetase beta chain